MEREILFRGKTEDGKWLYGLLIKCEYGYYITNDDSLRHVDGLEWTFDDNYEILPETVGQFTGLTDKNGAKIFEGDIVEAWSEGYKHIGEIRWRLEGQPAIIIYPAFANQGFWKIHGYKGMDNGVEVIGNIHDNSFDLS